MKRVQKVVRNILSDVDGKRILEVACGCAEFSIFASEFAKEVECIDLDDTRLHNGIHNCNNITFQIMDAAKLSYEDNSFDTVVMYNAIGHLDYVIEPVLNECRRVTKKGGVVYIISSFKMDKFAIDNNLIPLLKQEEITYTRLEENDFGYIKILA